MIIFRIKEIRNKKKITAYQLSKDINISRSYLSELENNKKMNVSLKVLFNIANYLDVNIKDLFYSTLDIEDLKQKMYNYIEETNINSEKIIEISQLIDLLINIKMKEELDK